MAGGGFSAHNKIIPGAYINFVSLKAAVQAVGQRGYVAMPLPFDYMPAGVTTLSADMFNANALHMFGVPSDSEQLRPLREAFVNASFVVVVSSNEGAVVARSTSYQAKHPGLNGNNISVVVGNALPSGYNMSIRYEGVEVERFKANALTDFASIVTSNYIDILPNAAIEVGTESLLGGSRGTETLGSYTTALGKLELEYWNVLAAISTVETVPALVEAYIRRLRDDQGKKVTAVLWNYICDYEGITVLNSSNNKEFVPWCAGAMASIPLNRSLTNYEVVSEVTETHNFTYAEMETAISGGLFTIINVDKTLRVLKDINSLRSYTEPKGELFSQNQVIRIIDQIGNDVLSIITNTYIGVVPNDEEGRAALWNDVVKVIDGMQTKRAIQNFTAKDVTVTAGPTADSVIINCSIQPVGAIELIYMTVSVV